MSDATHRVLAIGTFLVSIGLVAIGACGGGSNAPSPMPQVIQGSVMVEPFDLAAIQFRVATSGQLSGQVNWNDPKNDIDTAIVRGTCSREQLVALAPGCGESAVVVLDEGLAKPSRLTTSLDAGDYTLVISNSGPNVDTCSYRFEVN